MKRLLLIVLALALCLSLAACVTQEAEPSESTAQPTEPAEDFTGKPTLQLRVNETNWLTDDQTP